MKRNKTGCPGCRQQVWAHGGRYETHHSVPVGGGYCFMSGMPQPVEGRSDADMEERAKIVACLALEVQDADPQAVFKYLQVMPPLFVAELLQFALAVIDVEGKQVEDIWKKWGVA